MVVRYRRSGRQKKSGIHGDRIRFMDPELRWCIADKVVVMSEPPHDCLSAMQAIPIPPKTVGAAETPGTPTSSGPSRPPIVSDSSISTTTDLLVFSKGLAR